MRLLRKRDWVGESPIMSMIGSGGNVFNTEKFWDAGRCRLRMVTSSAYHRLEIVLFIFSTQTMEWSILLDHREVINIIPNVADVKQHCQQVLSIIELIENSMLELAVMLIDGV